MSCFLFLSLVNNIPKAFWKYALTGQTAGNKVSFLVNVALEAGKVLFTERVVYIVGSNCEGQEDKPIASCSGIAPAWVQTKALISTAF